MTLTDKASILYCQSFTQSNNVYIGWGNPSLVRMSLPGAASLSAAGWRHGRVAADGRFRSQLLPLLLPLLGVGGAGARPLIEPLLKLGTLTCFASQSDDQHYMWSGVPAVMHQHYKSRLLSSVYIQLDADVPVKGEAYTAPMNTYVTGDTD